MSSQDGWEAQFTFFSDKSICVEPIEEQLSTDAGLLIFRQFDGQHQLTVDFAAQLIDPRQDPTYSFLEMVRSRVFGILAGYEDQNDHQTLRKDAVFKLLADRSPEITLDVDVFDDPTHGQQQLTFFHGFYDQYQYLVRALTCAEIDLVVLPVLLYGTADPALGFVADLERVVTQLRQRFPGALIRLRADSGFARPLLYEGGERLEVEYSIGLGMNKVLKRKSDELLQTAVNAYQTTGEPQRLFTGFEYQAESWPSSRWVVVKCEANAHGTNRRAVVTNRPGARTGWSRRRDFNRRREVDPLGEGHACTWRMRVIKVAARIQVTARRIRIFFLRVLALSSPFSRAEWSRA